MICEIEIEFGGDIPKDPPKDEVDSILKKKNEILEFGFSNIKKASGKNSKSCCCWSAQIKRYNLEIISQVPIVPLKIWVL